MAKSDKLYSKSPKIEKDGDGKPGISKPKEADAEDMGIGGDDTEGNQTQMPVQVEQMHKRHSTEIKDMHKRHQDETKDAHKRHEKELKKAMGHSDTGEEKDTENG